MQLQTPEKTIVEQVRPTEALEKMCAKADLNYLCLLIDLTKQDELLSDPRISLAVYDSTDAESEMKYAVVLHKSADKFSTDTPIRINLDDGQSVDITYGKTSHMVLWSDNEQDVGMILADPEPFQKTSIPDGPKKLLQKTTRFVGQSVPESDDFVREPTFKKSIRLYRYFAKQSAEKTKGESLARFEARHQKVQRELLDRNIPTDQREVDHYEVLYNLLLSEVQEKLMKEVDIAQQITE